VADDFGSRQGTAVARPSGSGVPDGAAARQSCRIVRPLDGSIYAIDGSLPLTQQQLALEAAAGERPVRWEVDGCPLGTAAPGARLFWRLSPGAHRIRAVAGDPPADADEVRISVEQPL
jgi:penicillin-binding protein 1C